MLTVILYIIGMLLYLFEIFYQYFAILKCFSTSDHIPIIVPHFSAAIGRNRYFQQSFPLHFSIPVSLTTFSQRMAVRIRKLILRKLTGAAKNLGLDPFQDPYGRFGDPGEHSGCCNLNSVAGGEQVLP